MIAAPDRLNAIVRPFGRKQTGVLTFGKDRDSGLIERKFIIL